MANNQIFKAKLGGQPNNSLGVVLGGRRKKQPRFNANLNVQNPLAQMLMQQQSQQPKMQVTDATGQIPSKGQVTGLQDRFNKAFQLGSQGEAGGFGALGGGIATLVLGKKLAEAQGDRAKTELFAENLKLEQEKLQNKQAQQKIKKGGFELREAEIDNAKMLVTTDPIGRTHNIQENIALAGGELMETPTGVIAKDYMTKYTEMEQAGELDLGMPIKDLVKYNPALGPMLKNPYLRGNSKDVFSALEKAKKNKLDFDKSIMTLNSAKARAGGDANKANRDDLKAVSTVLGNMGRIMVSLNNVRDPEDQKQIFKEVLLPSLNATNQFMKTTNYKAGFDAATPQQLAEAFDGMQQGDPSAMQKIFSKYQSINSQANLDLQKPDSSPEKVKTKTLPLPVGGSQTEETQGALSDLDKLF